MSIEDMHYDFKMKLNKIDSNQNRNFLIPEIDWLLNEAQELFVKIVAKPRMKTHTGFEVNQRVIDDVRTLVVDEDCVDILHETVPLPVDYWHFIKGKVYISKDNCNEVEAGFNLRQHDDTFESSPFDKSSFEWREVNGTFDKNGIKLYTDGTFTIDKFCISYIKKLKYIHNAKNFRKGEYKLPSGKVLKETENCELPEHTHREIVDTAVLIATGGIQAPDYQIKLNKLNFNYLK